MEHIYIVIYRYGPKARWTALCDGEFDERRLAENLIEIRKSQGSTWEYAIVDGPIVNQAEMEAAEKAIAEF